MPDKSIAVIIGSLRKESFNRKIAQMLVLMAPERLTLEIVEISELPLYNQDLEVDAPPLWSAFRERMKQFDGFLFVTPEYNRSIPGALKNAIDVGSRPPGKSVWDGKPGGVVSAAMGQIGGFGGNHHLRQSLVCLNVITMARPEVYIGGVGKLFDENGNCTNDATKDLLERFIMAFAEWVDMIIGSKSTV